MEKVIPVTVERLPEGCWLATSDAVQGLVAQGRTVEETLQIARDIARKLLEAQAALVERLPDADARAEYPLVVGV